MLREISIRDVVLIESLDLEIGKGFTALTGETGAGKSILLDALGLALGDRADFGLIRKGANKAIANAIFETKNQEIIQTLKDLDIDIEDNIICLRRSLSDDGKSRAFINDTPINLNLMREISASLLEIHGQHSSIGLMDSAGHIKILDNYLCAEIGSQFIEQLEDVKSSYSKFEKAKKNLAEAKDRIGKSGAERDYLAHIIDELTKLSPQKGEETLLDSERRYLMASERVTEAIKEALDNIEGGKTLSYLSNASRSLSKIGKIESENGEKLSRIIDAAASALENAQNNLAEAQDYLNQAGYSIDLDPKQLERIEERLFALRAAARKHNVSVDSLNQVLAETEEKLSKIDNAEEELLKAEAEFKAADAYYIKSAQALSDLRIKGAQKFDEMVQNELTPLKLEKMRFRTRIQTENTYSRNGINIIAFEIAPNPGAGFGDLSQIASGGELSRLSLALKVVLASGSNEIVLIFDEVDQGIGGATADAVGKRLAILAKKSQVICVTHSPQVAARANNHLRIEKSVIDGITRTNIIPLSIEKREEELARMLAGEIITEEARAAARKLVLDNV